MRGLRVAPLPYDAEQLDVDLDALDEFLGWEVPRLVVVGASLMLFPHRLTAIAEVVRAHGIPLLYDASHVAGLVAEGRFQDPLREGADLVTFSTYKSFGGPAGGVIVTNDDELAEQVSNAVYPALVANYDVSRLLPLAAAALERERSGGEYADQCIANAQALAAALAAEGLRGARRRARLHRVPPRGDRRAGRRHRRRAPPRRGQHPRLGDRHPGRPGGRRPPRHPGDHPPGLRQDDMPAIAAAIAGALLHDRDVRDEVAELRRRHTGLRWCLTPEDLP